MQEADGEEGKKGEGTGLGWQWGQKEVGYRIRQQRLKDGAEIRYDSHGSTQGEGGGPQKYLRNSRVSLLDPLLSSTCYQPHPNSDDL